MSLEILCSDFRLSGCVSFAAITSPSPVVFCANAIRKLVSTFTNGSGALKWQSDGAIQTVAPQCVFSDGTYIHALGVGLWYRISSSNVVQATAVPYGLSSPTWGFAVSSSIVAIPYGSTGVQTLDATTGAYRYVLPDVTSRIALAIGGGGYIYCLNQDRAIGTTLAVDSNGVLTLVSNTRWSVPNGHVIRGALVDGTTLVIVTDHRVLLFSLADPTTPVFVSATKLTQTIRGVSLITAGNYWVATDETIPVQNQYFNLPTVAALVANGVLLSFSPYEGGAENTPTPYTYQGISAPLSLVATPAISPAGGSYSTGQTITITCSTVSATVRYTLDGSAPGPASPVYSGSFALSTATTVKAYATLTGYFDSAVASAAYTFVSATPVIGPATGSFTGVQTVTITAGAGATIYYTTDGSTPTTGSTVYTTGFTVATTTTVKAVAVEPGKTISGTATSVLTVSLGVNGVTFNAEVHAAAVIGNILYVGGNFTSVHDASGTLTRTRLAAIDLTTGLFTSFFSGLSVSAEIYTMRADSSGRLWVGGLFTTIGGLSRNYLARFDATGTLETVNFNLGTTGGGYVTDFAFDAATGRAFVAGSWSNASGAGVGHACMLVYDNTDSVVSAGPNVTQLATPRSMRISGSIIYIVGAPSTKAGVAFDLTSYALQTWNIAASGVTTIQSMHIAGSIAYLGGSISSINGTSRSNAGAVDLTSSAAVQSWAPAPNSIIESNFGLDSDSNGVIYAFGTFSSIVATSRGGAAAITAAGVLKTWNPGLTVTPDCYGVVVGSFVYIFGSFTNPSGGTRLYVTPIA